MNYPVLFNRDFLLFLLPLIAEYDDWLSVVDRIKPPVSVFFGEIDFDEAYLISFTVDEVSVDFLEFIKEHELEWFVVDDHEKMGFAFSVCISKSNMSYFMQDIKKLCAHTLPSEEYRNMLHELEMLDVNEHNEIVFTDQFKKIIVESGFPSEELEKREQAINEAEFPEFKENLAEYVEELREDNQLLFFLEKMQELLSLENVYVGQVVKSKFLGEVVLSMN